MTQQGAGHLQVLKMTEFQQQFLVISYLNLRGQTGFPVHKQLQVEQFLKSKNCDILNLQEAQINDETFKECKYIETNYSVLVNNAENGYGTASIVRNDLTVENVLCDTKGRVLVFDIAGITFGNLYLPSGTDGNFRKSRENYFGEIIPQILINRKTSGCIGGDFNCIISKKDATQFSDSKMSPCLARLVKALEWIDSYKSIHPEATIFSRYYESRGRSGATRIDRQYQWGEIVTVQAEYTPVALSDHLAHTVKIRVPHLLARLCCPRGRPMFKVREEVIKDKQFQERLKQAMEEWKGVKMEGLPILSWWELIVKPGIRKLAMERSKEINQDRRSHLNLLLLRQSYLIKKIQLAQTQLWDRWLSDLFRVQQQIQEWYRQIAEKIQHQSRVNEFQEAEQTRIYHHEIHQNYLKKSSILKLQTDDGVLVEGHQQCAQLLEGMVADILLYPAELDQVAQSILLSEVNKVVTEEENRMLAAIPDKEEVFKTLQASNSRAAPGTDGIPSFLYQTCWDFMGDTLTEIVVAEFQGEALPASLRTSMMVFGSKPKKRKSIKPKDKRRISLLNCDFKLIEGVEARRFRKLGCRVLSPNQYVAGKDRKIHHGIAKARDAIQSVMKSKDGCGIADTDFAAAFDWLVLEWVWKVLHKMGVESNIINRLQRLYKNSTTIVVVNNKLGRVMLDKRGSLRQGGCGSMEWFCIGIDPLLRYLERRLKGILISSLPVYGPSLQGHPVPLPPLEERYKLIAYCDDVKPSVTTMSEFITIDTACSLFERSSGCRLHRDITADKCKFLALGRWRGVLEQEDIPLKYMKLSDSLEMVGVELKATWSQTRKTNGELIQSKVNAIINSWKSGKFMDLTLRPWSLNNFTLTKIWFKSHTVDLRVSDITSVTSKVKSWLFQDQLEKPQEFVLHRPISFGGLGLHNVRVKALANLIKTFMETAAHPSYTHSLLHTLLYRYYVLQDDSIENPPPVPPYFPSSFFNTIRLAKEETPMNVETMSTSQWYRLLLEQSTTMEENEDNSRHYIKTRSEIASSNTDWELSWRRARLKGLGSQATSFLWKLLHNLLPTEERLARILPNSPADCKSCPTPALADLPHCLFECVRTKESGSWLLSLIRQHDPSVSASKLLKLDFTCSDSAEMPLVWITAQTLLYIWGVRKDGKIVSLATTRAKLESKISLLRETRYSNQQVLMAEYISM